MEENQDMRINRYLALCGLGSRRFCENLVKESRVSINGVLVDQLAQKVNAGDRVQVDGQLVVAPSARRVVIFHKPAGYLCSRGDQYGRPTIYDLLPADCQNLHYVGRLDANTRGLLLLTNDGELSRRLTHPDFALTRCYRVQLNQPLVESEAEILESGLVLADGTEYRPVRLSGIGYDFDIELREGKKREIREMMRHFGLRVLDLFRYEYGGIWLDDLPEAQVRDLEPSELQDLVDRVGL